MKYELLLKDIYKNSERAGLLHEMPALYDAMHVMKVSEKRNVKNDKMN